MTATPAPELSCQCNVQPAEPIIGAIMEVEPDNRTDHPGESARERFAPGYREACERKREHREIEAIARELDRPTGEIAEIYAELYADLRSRAQVTDYLPVLVARKVRARYSQ